MKRTSLLLVLGLFAASVSFGAVCTANVQHPGIRALAMRDKINPDDPVSFRWWFHFRDTIATSTRYCLVNDPNSSYIMLSVIGSDTNPRQLMADQGAISFAAYFTSNAMFINHWLYVGGAMTADRYAENALADLDHELQTVPSAILPKE